MLGKIKIGPKLIGGFSIVIILLVGLAVYNYYSLNDLREMQDHGAERADNAIDADHMRRVPYKIYQVIADAEINRNLKESEVNWQKVMKEYNELHEMLHKQAITETEKKWLDENGDAIDKVIALYTDEMLPLLGQPKSAQNEEKIREIDTLPSHIDIAYSKTCPY